MNIGNTQRTSQGIRAAALAVAAMLVVSACAESSRPEAAGEGRIRGINGIVTSPELVFLIEERPQDNINFRAVSGFNTWDALSYTFNFDLIRPNATEPERIASQFVDVVADTDYSIVLSGSLTNPSIVFWEEEQREWDGSETVFEVDFFHVSPLLGEVDIYYDIEGTVPVLGNEIGTLGDGGRIPYVELAEGDYELIITAPDDPTTILFQSVAITRLPAERVTIGLFDTDPSIVAPVGVNIIFDGGAAQGLSDINSPPQLRLSHASFGVENINGYFNDDFGTVIFSDIAFNAISPSVDLTETATPLDVALVSAPGTPVAEADIQLINNTRRTVFFWGLPGTHLLRTLVHDARPLDAFPVARITDLSSNVTSIDIYDVEAGTVLDDDVLPRFGGAIPGISTDFFDVEPGMREFVLTLPDEKTPIATPLTFDFADGDVVDMIIVDTADPAVVELRVFESLP